MERMPGDGFQPTVEEYLTQMAPPTYSSDVTPTSQPKPEIQGIDEALRLRDDVARRSAETERTEESDWLELRAAFWSNIDQFLAMAPRRHERLLIRADPKPVDIARVGGYQSYPKVGRNGKTKRGDVKKPYWELDGWPLGGDEVGRHDYNQLTYREFEIWFLLVNGDLLAASTSSSSPDRFVTADVWRNVVLAFVNHIEHGAAFAKRTSIYQELTPPLAVMLSGSSSLVDYLRDG